MKSVRFIDQAIVAGGHKNDFALATKLGWSTGAISMYRQGKRVMDDEACLALALEIGISPLEIIGAACLDRAEKSGKSSLWEVFMNRAAATAGAVLVATSVNVFLTPSPANAASMRVSEGGVSTSIDYAKTCASGRQPRPAIRTRTARRLPTALPSSLASRLRVQPAGRLTTKHRFVQLRQAFFQRDYTFRRR